MVSIIEQIKFIGLYSIIYSSICGLWLSIGKEIGTDFFVGWAMSGFFIMYLGLILENNKGEKNE